ncbi:MAG: dihydropteroate synthase [Planctomycetota bacterium]
MSQGPPGVPGPPTAGNEGDAAEPLPPWPHRSEAGYAPGARRPALMGVLNVTPDSFSDGGRFLAPERAIEHGLRLVGDGADVLDVGGESTRPGAAPVTADEELRRVLPVVEGLARATRAPLSIDTTKASVARAAVEAGATIVNDVSAGLADPAMLPTVAELSAGSEVHLVLMHRQGTPETMQAAPTYDDVVGEVLAHLKGRVRAAEDAGVPFHRITVDPGIGFGKRLAHNLALLASLEGLRALGRPILLGASRKSFIGHLTGAEDPSDWLARERRDAPSERIGGTAAAIALAAARGAADVLRVHDVAIMKEAVLVARAIAAAGGGRGGS